MRSPVLFEGVIIEQLRYSIHISLMFQAKFKLIKNKASHPKSKQQICSSLKYYY